MEGFLPIFFLAVVLKIPVLGAIWLIWWAGRRPEVAEDARPDDGGSGHRRRRPLRPRPRGPHSSPFGNGVQVGRARRAEHASDRRERVLRRGAPTPTPTQTD